MVNTPGESVPTPPSLSEHERAMVDRIVAEIVSLIPSLVDGGEVTYIMSSSGLFRIQLYKGTISFLGVEKHMKDIGDAILDKVRDAGYSMRMR